MRASKYHSTLLSLGILTLGFSSLEALSQAKSQFDPVVWKPSETTLEAHTLASKRRMIVRFGISETTLNKAEKHFFEIRKTKKRIGGPTASSCIDLLDDTMAARDTFFGCVIQSRSDSLNEHLFELVHDKKMERIQSFPPSLEKEKTIALLAYLEDLIRENLHLNGQNASWFSFDQGKFLSLENFYDFPFEDGDILLTMGNSWISSMISQSTFPQKKYSHAFMVRVDSKGFRTMEAIIEKGVISRDFDYFRKEDLNGVLVLRWGDPNQRAKLAKRAAEIAQKWVQDKVQYDIEMNIHDSTKLFCSELVLLAYAQAAGLRIDSLVPEFSQIRSDKVYELLEQVGVGKREMPSPGDLMAASQLKVVASWRPQKDLMRLWNRILMGDVVVERLELNYQVKPALGQLAGWMIMAVDGVYGTVARLLGSDQSLIPAATSKSSLKYLITLQKGVFDPVIKDALKLARQKSQLKEVSLFSVAPWDLRAYLSYMTQENPTARSVFYDPKNPPRKPQHPRRGSGHPHRR